MTLNGYDKHIKKFLENAKDEAAKNEVIDCYNYLTRGFATEIAMVERDYQLGLRDSSDIRKIQVKCYTIENKLRGYLGLSALPEINSSIL